MRKNKEPMFIGPGQTAIAARPGLKLANYYSSTTQVVFDKKLNRQDLAKLSFDNLPLAASSTASVSKRALHRMQLAIEHMTEGNWQSVYVPTKPGDGNNSGNGMTGIFLQRPDLEVIVEPLSLKAGKFKAGKSGTGKSKEMTTKYLWPKIRRYESRHRIQPENYNYSLVYHHYKQAFEAAFDLMIFSICKLDSKLKHRMIERKRLGLYFGITDYYGDPDILPAHLLKQATANNPAPEIVNKAEYLQQLHRYREKPILPGNYHTDGIEKSLDIQGIFTILNRGCTGGETLIRRRGITRYKHQTKGGKTPADITVRLKTPEGHAGFWVPSWGRTEVEHTPGPIQGGHRTIIVFGLDSTDTKTEIKESETRKYYGSHYETRAWDKRSWYRGSRPIEVPDSRLWNAK